MAQNSRHKDYNLRLIDTMYKNVPAFTDIFDEETWYIFVFTFVLSTILIAFILSKYIKLRPVDF